VADPSVRGGAFARETMVGGEYFEIAPLPHAASEARAIARFGGPGTEVYTGAAASEARVRAASLQRFGVVHFATHGLLSRRNPSRSALLLAAEGPSQGLLTVREIYRLKVPSDLVVLSACQTARGRVLAGEGVQGLTQAFFHAGARSVIASLWDVNDRRTERLMTGFYGHLADGERKTEALAHAKRDLLASEPGLAPRYWAAFVLIGECRGTVSLQRPSAWTRLVDEARQWLFGADTRNVKGPSRDFSSGPSTSTTQ
jgi:CHAT domain-containing protein